MNDYYRNTEVARAHGVSEKSVRNWIELSIEGKLDLRTVSVKGKTFLANSRHNELIIETLVARGKKYRNKKNPTLIRPSPDFYKTYSQEQIIDICYSLDKSREIPSHYRYMGEGAALWDQHLELLYASQRSNMLTTTIELLQLEASYFDFLLREYDYINIVDLGVGNGLAAKKLLEDFATTSRLKKYIGIDCSPELLKITEKNIHNWLGSTLPIETHVKDFSHERFGDILAKASDNKDGSRTINIVLFLGGTIGNLKDPRHALNTIRESMGKNDILITSDELDNENARKLLGTGGIESFDDIKRRNHYLLNLLSLRPSMYELVKSFDEERNTSLLQAKLKQDVNIEIKTEAFTSSILLPKAALVLLFRMAEWTGHEIDLLYEASGFTQIRTTKLHNQEFVLLISKITT